MVPNKLFRETEFYMEIRVMFVNVLNKCTTTCQKNKSKRNNRLSCCRPNKINK